jgi:lauroyl/myristoyl acyltransferase
LGPLERRLWILAYVGVALLVAALFLAARRPADAAHSIAPGVGNMAIAVLRGIAAALLLVSVCLLGRLRASL